MKTRNHNLLFFASLCSVSLAIVISLPSKFTTWSGGWGPTSSFFQGPQGQAQKALLESWGLGVVALIWWTLLAREMKYCFPYGTGSG